MKEAKGKRRIALFGSGVLGGGTSGQGIPVMSDLFDRLSVHYDIVYYSFKRIDRRQVPAALAARQIITFKIPERLKYILLMLRFAWDQLFHPVSLIFSVSIYPTGQAAVVLGKIFKLPAVVQIIGLEVAALPEINYGGLTKPWLAKITRWVFKRADIIIALAHYQKEVAKKSLPTSRYIDVLPMRVDITRFRYRQRAIIFPVQFIHIAFYGPVKDQKTMFEAFAKVAHDIDCHLTVIGDGFNTRNVQRLIHDLDIVSKVTFTGFLAQPDILPHLDRAHILLHTSLFEAGCAAVQEAMASGVAVCGTEVGVLADIGSQYCSTVQPGDKDGLALKILELVRDDARYQQMTKDAFQLIKSYDAVWAAENYRQYIHRILEQN